MKSKIVCTLLGILLFCGSLFAQTTPLRIDSNVDKGSITINTTTFHAKSTLEAYEKVLGKATRIEKVAGKDKIFAYDALGIALSLKANTNLVQEVYLTYFDDGDKRTARSTYSGTLQINGKVINTTDDHEKIMHLAGIQQVMDMDNLYMGKNNTQSFILMLYYPETTLGQVGFSFQ
jgi:hypothetical protein